MLSMYFGVRSCCTVHIGVGDRSGTEFPPTSALERSKKVEPRGAGLGMRADQKSGNPVNPVLNVCPSLFLNSETPFSAVYLRGGFDHAACFVLDSFFININLFLINIPKDSRKPLHK